MAVTNYLSVDGQVYGHSVDGDPSKTTYYTLDALGSVVATTDNKGNVLNTYEYKPFSGEVLQKTGSAPDPRFMWNGSHGYRTTNLPQKQFLTHYVRARHYQGMTAAWTSVDPLWPQEPAYGYVRNMVTTAFDYFGMYQTVAPPPNLSKPPAWFPKNAPPRVVPASTSVGAGVVAAGAVALVDLAVWAGTGGTTCGPFTGLGTRLGEELYPVDHSVGNRNIADICADRYKKMKSNCKGATCSNITGKCDPALIDMYNKVAKCHNDRCLDYKNV
ncbi:hypothetical protein QM565_30490 [Geitlerinema splendidum]|nr:hypothetical protein [Geitlerinema splendidum]